MSTQSPIVVVLPRGAQGNALANLTNRQRETGTADTVRAHAGCCEVTGLGCASQRNNATGGRPPMALRQTKRGNGFPHSRSCEDPGLNQVLTKCRPVVSLHTESLEINPMDCDPGPERSRVERLSICITNRSFVERGDSTGSISYRPPLKPFPEGELLDSPGFAAQRLPWVRDIHLLPEP